LAGTLGQRRQQAGGSDPGKPAPADGRVRPGGW
jgi:hypothetical protein